MASFKAVLFDFDGVIVDSTPMHLDGWAAAYQEVFRKEPDASLLASLMGQSTRAIATLLADRVGKKEGSRGTSYIRDSLIRLKGQYVLDHVQNIPLIAGIGAFMEKLVAAKTPYGIASNSPRSFLKAGLIHHRLPFTFYLGAEDYTEPKPHPEAYLLGGKQLAWSKEDHGSIAVFEDSTHGIEAAVGARMTAIGVGSQHPHHVLIDAGAKYCITNFQDTEFLDQHFF